LHLVGRYLHFISLINTEFTCYRYKYLFPFGGPKLLQTTERRNTRRTRTSFSLVSHEDMFFAAGNTTNTVPDPSSEPAPNTLSTKTETAENERYSWYRTLRINGLMDWRGMYI